MKKFIFFSLFLAIGVTSVAQDAVPLPLILGNTLVNTGTASRLIPQSGITSGSSGIVIQVVFNKISGTGAGTAQLMGSLDGVNYVNIGSAYTITNVTTQSTLFTVSAPVPKWLKVLSTGSGTESVQLKYLYRAPRYQSP